MELALELESSTELLFRERSKGRSFKAAAVVVNTTCTGADVLADSGGLINSAVEDEVYTSKGRRVSSTQTHTRTLYITFKLRLQMLDYILEMIGVPPADCHRDAAHAGSRATLACLRGRRD